MSNRLAIALLAAAALLPGAALADTLTEPYVGVSVEELYDSNVLNSRGSDEVTRVTPEAGLLLRDPRFTLHLDYGLAIHTYAEGKADNSLNHIASLVGKAAVSPRLDVDTRIHFVDGDDPVLLDRAGVAVPLGGFTDLDARLGASWRAGRRLTIDVAYDYRRSRFDLASTPNPLAYDGDEHRVDADLAWRVARRLSLRAVGRYDHFVAIDAMSTLGDAVGGGAGVDYELGPLTRARIEGGALQFTSASATWFGLAEIVHRGETSRWRLSAVRDLFGGTGASEAIWLESAMAEGAFRLGKYVDLRIRAGGYRNGVAPDGDAYVSGLLAHADIGWRTFGNSARIELYGEHRAQDALGGLAFGDLQRTVIGLRLVAVAGADLLSLGEIP